MVEGRADPSPRRAKAEHSDCCDGTDEADLEVDTAKAEIDKDSEHKGAKKGGMHMAVLYDDGARDTGGSHMTHSTAAAAGYNGGKPDFAYYRSR